MRPQLKLAHLCLLALVVALSACQEESRPLPVKERPVSDLANVHAKLAFTCAYEKDAIPKRDPEAEQLYKHARWLRKNNLLKADPSVYPKIERLIRISTAYGHDKANLELRQMIGKGTADSDNVRKETLDLTEDLIKRGIPGGYYDMGRYLEAGYGVKQDKDLALKYYRKAADLGSPEGQYVVGDRLTGVDDKAIQDIGVQMWNCAAEQGHGAAGLELGIWRKHKSRYPESLQAFQLGVKAGESGASSFLYEGFNGPTSDDRLYFLGQQKDEERFRRYKAINQILFDYSYLNPKVPEIDEIVPLPPAKLPAWDGKLQWLTEHEANVPPPLPTEERIKEMAKAKNLDPSTGRPLPPKQSAAPVERRPVLAVTPPAIPLGTTLPSGALCPQTGLWQCTDASALGGAQRNFAAGETLPSVLAPVTLSLWQKLKGAPQNRLAETVWTLVAYSTPTAIGKDA